MKLSTSDGAPALPEITRNVEQIIQASVPTAAPVDALKAGEVQTFAARPGYLEDLAKKINFEAISRAGGQLCIRSFVGDWARIP